MNFMSMHEATGKFDHFVREAVGFKFQIIFSKVLAITNDT